MTGATLPPLLRLEVERIEFCDQATTDQLLKYLWDNKPQLVLPLVEIESYIDPMTLRHSSSRKPLEKIIEFLRTATDLPTTPPPSRLGMLDLLSELCRRIRVALNVPPASLGCPPLAETIKGPFKPLPAVEFWAPNKFTETEIDAINRVIDLAYKSHPEAFYEYAEQRNRALYSYEIEGHFIGVLNDARLAIDSELKWLDVVLNAKHRVHVHLPSDQGYT